MKNNENLEKIGKKREEKFAISNELIQCQSSFSEAEFKCMEYMLSLVKPDDTPETEYEFDINEYWKIMGEDKGGRQADKIKDILRSFATSSDSEDPKEPIFRHAISLITKPETEPNSLKVRYRYTKEAARYIFNLKANYTIVEKSNMLIFKGKYSHRLYLLFKAVSGIKKSPFRKTYSINEFKSLMNISQTQYAGKDGKRNLRMRVIDPALYYINAYSDLTVTYVIEKNKEGIEEIIFDVFRKDDETMEMIKNTRNTLLDSEMKNLKDEEDKALCYTNLPDEDEI